MLVKVVGHEVLNSSAPFSSSPSFRLSDTGSAAPSPFILEEIPKFFKGLELMHLNKKCNCKYSPVVEEL